MVSFLTHFYYFFGLFLIIPNYFYLKNRKQFLKTESLEDKVFHYLFVSIPVFLWFVLGLFTFQWPYYLLFLLVSFISHLLTSGFIPESWQIIIYKSNCFLEICFILFVVINYLYLGIDISLFNKF